MASERDQDAAYFQEAGVALQHLIGKEDDRHRLLERKAAFAATSAVAFTGFSFQPLLSPGLVSAVPKVIAVIAFTGVVATLVLAYVALAVTWTHVIEPRQLVGEKVIENPIAQRHRDYSQHLVRVLDQERAAVEKKAVWVKWLQTSAMFSVLVSLLFLLATRIL